MASSKKAFGLLFFMLSLFVFISFGSVNADAAKAPSTVKNFKVSTVTDTTATFTWSKVSCKGYIIRYVSGKGIKKITSSSRLTYTLKNLSPGTMYMVKIQAFNYKSSTSTTRLGSAYTYLVFCTRPSSTSLSLTSGDGYVKASWGSVDCDGYRLYRKAGKNGTWKLIAKTKSTSFKDTNVTFGTTYYYRVRAYSTCNGSNYYGGYSSVKNSTPKQVISSTQPTDKAALLNSQTLTPTLTHDPELDSLVSSIINSITDSSMTPAQKLKACYDYIIYNYTYGYPSSWDLTLGTYTVRYSSSYDQTAYNNGKYTIYNKVGTCIGMNSAFLIFARRLGFEAVLEEGYIGSREHYWVNIKLSGNWYLFDPNVERDCYVATGYSYIANWCWCEDLYWPCEDEGFGSPYYYSDEWGYRNGFNGFKNYTVYKN